MSVASVRLSLFSDVAVLRVRRAVDARQIAVLVAGVRRVFETEVKLALIDVRGAEMDDAAAEACKAFAPNAAEVEKGIKIVMISPDLRVSDLPDLPAALAALEFPSRDSLLAWLTVEDELDVLLVRKAELELVTGVGGAEGRKKAEKARSERVRLERMKEGLSASLSQWGKRVGIWKKTSAPPEVKEVYKTTLTELRRERTAK
mgnify:CR=1 FL=1